MNTPYSSDSALNIGLLSICSIRNKVEYIVELLSEFPLDLVCVTETWLYESDTGVIEAALPKTPALLHVPRSSWVHGRGGGVAVINSWALSITRLSSVDMNVSSFEHMELIINENRSVVQLAVVYHCGHPSME